MCYLLPLHINSLCYYYAHREQVKLFVLGLFEQKDLAAFKLHLRDFLVQLKEFSEGGSNAELFLEEKEKEQAQAEQEQFKRDMAIPGMVPQHDKRRDTMSDM